MLYVSSFGTLQIVSCQGQWECIGMAGAKTYRANSVMPLSVDRERLMEVALRVYPELASSLCANIADNKSYERIENEQGRIGINRYDFYGYRRKIVDIYNTEG